MFDEAVTLYKSSLEQFYLTISEDWRRFWEAETLSEVIFSGFLMLSLLNLFDFLTLEIFNIANKQRALIYRV